MNRLLATVLLLTLAFSAPPGRAAINIQFDYSYDNTGFFSGANIGRRAILEAAANVFESRLTLENFGAITPSGTNTWSLTIQRPGTGSSLVTISNPVIAADTITIYTGGRSLAVPTLAASYFNYTWSGDNAWNSLFQSRDSTVNFDSVGGSLWFNSNATYAPWYFDSDPATRESFPGEYDFFSVAEHEILHLLGFADRVNAFAAQVSGAAFDGAHAEALYGGPVPLSSQTDLDHWNQSVTYDGLQPVMQPVFYYNQRKDVTDLDFAVLQDIGYTINTVPEPAASTLLLAAGFLLASQRRRVLRSTAGSPASSAVAAFLR